MKTLLTILMINSLVWLTACEQKSDDVYQAPLSLPSPSASPSLQETRLQLIAHAGWLACKEGKSEQQLRETVRLHLVQSTQLKEESVQLTAHAGWIACKEGKSEEEVKEMIHISYINSNY